MQTIHSTHNPHSHPGAMQQARNDRSATHRWTWYPSPWKTHALSHPTEGWKEGQFDPLDAFFLSEEFPVSHVSQSTKTSSL